MLFAFFRRLMRDQGGDLVVDLALAAPLPLLALLAL